MCENHWHCFPERVAHNCPLDTDRQRPCPDCGGTPDEYRLQILRDEIELVGYYLTSQGAIMPDEWLEIVYDAMVKDNPLATWKDATIDLVSHFLRLELGVEIP